jgi:hypothetical protein
MIIFSRNLSLLEFIKSVNGLNKEAKLLQATMRNSKKINRAFEKAFNVLFYTNLSQIGLNPFALFLLLSSLILAFAFKM